MAGARPATAIGGGAVRRSVNKDPSASAGRVGRPATAAPGKKSISTSAAGASDETSVTANENLAGLNDPVAQAMQDRLKAGGLTSTIKDVDAKKQGVQIPKLAKLVLKPGQAALTNFVEENNGGSIKIPSSGKKTTTIKAAKSPSPAKRRVGTAAAVR